LGDRQSSHPVKTLLQYYGKSLEALPGVAYPGFRDNRSTLNTKTGFLKKNYNFLFIPCGRLSWLPVSFLLHVKYTLSYPIVSKDFFGDSSSILYRLDVQLLPSKH